MGKTRDEMLVLMVCVYEGEHASAPLPLVVMQGGEESREARGAIECLVAAHGHEQGGKEKGGGHNPSRWYSDAVAWIFLCDSVGRCVDGGGGARLDPPSMRGVKRRPTRSRLRGRGGLNIFACLRCEGSLPVRERPRADGFGFDGQFTRFGEVGRA